MISRRPSSSAGFSFQFPRRAYSSSGVGGGNLFDRLPEATLGNHFELRFPRGDRMSRTWKRPR